MKQRRIVMLSLTVALVGVLLYLYFDRGPLWDHDARATQGRATTCAPIGEDRRVTFGAPTLEHESRRKVVIEKVELTEVDGLSIVGALMLPIHETEGEWNYMGTALGFPPDLSGPGYGNLAWDDTVPAIGFTVPPLSDDPTPWQLVLGVELAPGQPYGSSVDILVTYRAGWRTYRVQMANSFRLTEAEACGEDWPPMEFSDSPATIYRMGL